MPIKKFTFIAENQLDNVEQGSEYSVTVTKNGSIYFSPFIAKTYELDNKIIKMYADVEKKTIAWREIKEGNLDQLKNVRQLKVNKDNSNIFLMVGKLLKKIGITKEMLPIKNVPVERYHDQLEKTEYSLIDLRSYAKTKE